MAIADASLTSIRDTLELDYGTGYSQLGIPLFALSYKERRMVNETLGQDKELTASEEIVNDRRNPDNIHVGSAASGDIVAELTGGGVNVAQNTWDEYWLSALGATGFSTFVGANPINATGTVTPTNGADPDEIVLTMSAGTWPAFTAGEFVFLAGFTGVRQAFNSIFKVKSGGGTTALTLAGGARVPNLPGTENSSVVGAAQLQSATDSTVARSFVIERKYSLTSEFAVNDGMVLTGFDVDIRPKQPMRVTWHWLGKEEVNGASTLAVTNEINTLTTGGAPLTAGTFTITVNAQVTSPALNFNATAAQVQAALEALSSVGTGNVKCFATTGANLSVAAAVVTIVFVRALQGTDITISGVFTGLTPSNGITLATTVNGGVPVLTSAITSRRSFSPVTDLKSFSLDEDGHSFFLNSFSLSFKNGAYSQDERAGTLGAVGIGQGSFSCTGSYEFYYDNTPTAGAGAVHDQFQKFVDKELAVCVGNSQGDAWMIHLPRINWTSGRRDTPGKSQAVKGKVGFQAAKGPLYLVKIARL